MLTPTEYIENPFQCLSDTGLLLGVHCAPVRQRLKESLTVVIVAGQPQTRVGAHRMFVELARHLAGVGVSSVRFDCAGWGDSVGPARSFEESRFDILAIIRSIQRNKPAEKIAVLGLCDGATAAWLSLPLLKADQRDILALIMINPWTDQKRFEAKAKLSNYYLERLKSREFWGKLLSGKMKIGGAIGGAMESIKMSQQNSADDEDDLSSQLMAALQASRTNLLLALCDIDLTAQTFSTWMEHDDRLRKWFPSENIFRHASADHTFSHPQDWLEACEWISAQLEHLLGQSKPH
jgi:uncharacterized protein